MQAKAARMTSTDDNRQIRYEGDALMWQGSNRMQADRIDIDERKAACRRMAMCSASCWIRPRLRSRRKAPCSRLSKRRNWSTG